jgi:trans-aconitate methyltransferase
MNVSDEYKQQLKQTHESKNWGTTANLPKEVVAAIEKYKPKSILDFGCGKGQIVEVLKQNYPNMTVYGYDPAFNDKLPDNVDMIMSTDVLEHVEPNQLANTLADLDKRCNIVQYHLIACFKAKKVLPDGRNAHLIIETPDWWQEHMYGKETYNVVHENVIGYIKKGKKGIPKAVVKYECLLEKI